MAIGAETLSQLLVEFERAYRLGQPMDAVRELVLAGVVAERLTAVYFGRQDEIPVRRAGKQVLWRLLREVERIPSCAPLIAAYQSELEIGELQRSLDRMMRAGTRRSPSTGRHPPPRLAEQVANLQTDGADRPIRDPERLIDDCWKYAIYDELHNLVRRRRAKTDRRAARPGATNAMASRPPTTGLAQPLRRQRDARSLLRLLPKSALTTLASGPAAESLAFAALYEYQLGGFDRAQVDHLAAVPFGNATLGKAFDRIDAAFERLDLAMAASAAPTSRRARSRVVGLNAQQFAEILDDLGLRKSPASLPKLAGRARERCLAACRSTARGAGARGAR